MAHLIAIQPDPSSPADIRAAGWVVAVHNDYKLAGVPHTFWLFTREEVPGDPEYAITGRGQGRFARGEGRTDADALNVVRMMVGLPLRRVIEPDPALATYCDGPHTPPDCPHCVTREGADAHPVAAARYREHRAAAKLAAFHGVCEAVGVTAECPLTRGNCCPQSHFEACPDPACLMKAARNREGSAAPKVEADAPDAPPGTVLGTVASYRLSFQMKPVAEAAAQLAGLAIFHPADGSTQVAGTREQLDRFRALLDAVSRFVGGTH